LQKASNPKVALGEKSRPKFTFHPDPWKI
jgi:hypothetical protein